MIISCPTCHAKFKIPPDKIGDGKNLTCAKCKHKWFFKLPPKLVDTLTPTPAQIEAAIEKIVSDQMPAADTDAPPMAAINHLAQQAQQGLAAQDKHHHYSLKRAWILFALLILSIVGLGSFERGLMVSIWPATARIYDLVGMPVPVLGAGLEIKDLSWELVRLETIDDNTGDKIVQKPTEITVKGNIINHTDGPLTIPELLAKTLDRQNKAFHQTTFKAAGEKILPNETIPFVVKLPLIENTDFRVLVTFSPVEAHGKAPIASNHEPAPAPAASEHAPVAEHSAAPVVEHESAASAEAVPQTEAPAHEPATETEHAPAQNSESHGH